MKLGRFFTLEELTQTNCGLKNVPNEEQKQSLKSLVEKTLDPVRAIYGGPINVNSGFRTLEVNIAIKSKSKTSQHLKGEAADLDCDNNALLFRLIRDNCPFDQLIWERGNDTQPDWVHVSYSTKRMRKQILRFDGVDYLPFK